MQLYLNGSSCHLSYCTNVHNDDCWDDLALSLKQNIYAIKSTVSPNAPMGLGLRLSALVAQQLNDPKVLQALLAILGDDFYVYTLNGFPYGDFHGKAIKQQVYLPDWSDAERLRYSNLLADHLALLLPRHITGSISTVPCAYKMLNADSTPNQAKLELMVEHLLRAVVHLNTIRAGKQKTIVLALEPEPFCMLETTADVVNFFENYLFSAKAVKRLAQLSGLNATDAEQAIRRHLGVCFDVCHAAVVFEDPELSIARLKSAQITIAKLQLSSAIKVKALNKSVYSHLAKFAEPVYLHQTFVQKQDQLLAYVDLDQALSSFADILGAQLRTHYHVPIFLEQLEYFSTTQSVLRKILDLHRLSAICQHLEVETYTWHVLPKAYRDKALSALISQEILWVKNYLQLN